MKKLLMVALLAGFLLDATASISKKNLFVVGQRKDEVIKRAQKILNTKQVGQANMSRDQDLDMRYYRMANHQEVYFIFYKHTFIQLEVIREESWMSLKVREDYKDPKDSSGYPIAYVVENLGKTIDIGRVFSRDKLAKFLAETT